MTFFAVNRNGQTMPAYARYIAIPGNNFLWNTWRDPSEANASSALIRTGLGFLGRLSGNAFEEFWPRRRKQDLPSRPYRSHDCGDRMGSTWSFEIFTRSAGGILVFSKAVSFLAGAFTPRPRGLPFCACSHKRYPPRNALALSPRRAPGAISSDARAFPPPSTT